MKLSNKVVLSASSFNFVESQSDYIRMTNIALKEYYQIYQDQVQSKQDYYQIYQDQVQSKQGHMVLHYTT